MLNLEKHINQPLRSNNTCDYTGMLIWANVELQSPSAFRGTGKQGDDGF